MFMDATLFFTMAFVFFVGFYQAFCNLAPQGDSQLSPYNILMIMLRIFFGSSYLGFDVAFNFSPWFGPLVMFFYIAITALFLTTILISIFNQSFSTIATNASQEHQFIFTAKVMEFVESESLFPFVPPFNLLQLFFICPLYPFMSTRNYAFYNRTAIRFVYAPFLLIIYVYERFWLRRSLSSRRNFTRTQYGINNRYVDPTVLVQSKPLPNKAQQAPIDMSKSSLICPCGKPNKFSASSLASNSHDTVVAIKSRATQESEETSEQQLATILARQHDLELKLDQILQALNHERLF
ncbi:hypothetical protein DSO57_1032489 [Entomophthora muscae]|uniref:Uncharacterized protein n=1 Tax=Entomophthora muscae TaxID=34485 RepID=A0ACC2UAT4_9FUNG|nr:hypothetical protein DSO57_1032489 [Entomophthora muscae]